MPRARRTGRVVLELSVMPDNLSRFQRCDLSSAALGRKVSYGAYVPESATVLPVLFLLHGTDGTFNDWKNHAHASLQRLSNAHRIVVITPEGGREGWYLDSPLLATHRYQSHILMEVLPDVDARFRTNGRRGIAGQSAGGHGALTLALTHPQLFLSASSMSGVLDLTAASDRTALKRALGPYAANRERWELRSARHLVLRDVAAASRLPMLITTGSSDRWAPVNRAFATELTALAVPHLYREQPGGHDWRYWTSVLPEHVAFHADVLNHSVAR
jgi:S-formylglutathione hydrolase FrmB